MAQTSGAVEEARAQYGLILSEAPNDVEVLVALGALLAESDNVDERRQARTHLERALELEPSNAAAQDALGRLGSTTAEAVSVNADARALASRVAYEGYISRLEGG